MRRSFFLFFFLSFFLSVYQLHFVRLSQLVPSQFAAGLPQQTHTHTFTETTQPSGLPLYPPLTLFHSPLSCFLLHTVADCARLAALWVLCALIRTFTLGSPQLPTLPLSASLHCRVSLTRLTCTSLHLSLRISAGNWITFWRASFLAFSNTFSIKFQKILCHISCHSSPK